MNGVESYCIANPSEGKLLLKNFLEQEEEPIININVAILIGLYRSDREQELARIQVLANEETYHTTVACAVSAFEPENDQEAEELLYIIDGIESSQENYLVNLPRVYTNFIRNEKINAESVVARCFEKLNWLLNLDIISVKQSTLWRLQFVEGYDKQVFKIVNSINNVEFDDRLGKLVSNVLSRFKDQKFFFEFLKSYGEKNGVKFNAENFEHPISVHKTKDLPSFSKYLIELLIHDKGEIRFIGKMILTHVTIGTGRSFRFGIDILELSALEQTKLWVSVFNGYAIEPESSFPLLMPLRKSKYPIVVESFISKVEELVENYSYSVVKEFKGNVILDDEDDKMLLERIEAKYQEFSNYWYKKANVMELNPLLTQSKLFSIFIENYGESLSKSIERTKEDKGSLLSMLPVVTLAKGGGWKHQQTGQISQLSSISAELKPPRQYFLSPERFDLDIRISYLENWKEEFKEWEAILSSSENI